MNATNDPHNEPGDPDISRQRRHISLVWLIPAIALFTGAALLAKTWFSAGPEITITFLTASGLEAGKTAVKYKDVTVGTVSSLALDDGGDRVRVTVQLDKSAENLARADTRFWVVRPRVGMGGVTGIDTLLSGAYIGVDKGASEESKRAFSGLEAPPAVINGMPGSQFEVLTDDLGSLDIGSPVYYRRVQVGRIASYRLKEDGKNVALQVFVDAPYNRFVTANTRFWNASGLDVSVGANGFRLRTQTIASIVTGGIAFATPDSDSGSPAAGSDITYRLAKDQDSAMAPPDGPAIFFQLRFERSLHGLAVGAPVEFSSIKIGQVVSVELDYNHTGYRFPSVVGIEVYPNRMGNVLNKLPKVTDNIEQETARFTRDLVDQGLRAQAASSNLLTGQLYISLDFIPQAPKVKFDLNAHPLRLPTTSGGFDRLQEQLASIVSKVDKMPLESISNNLNATLGSLDKTLRQVNGQTLPETTQLLKQMRQTAETANGLMAEDSPIMMTLGQNLQELLRALRSMRTLADQIERHPESLLQGRPHDPPLTQVSPSPHSGATK
ncbi:MCE family protein [Lonsdalea britannica]|uniref:MCE family protein n=1 Tax=Lonsdalea britannica TaxID=1082704 RepID=A0AAD0SHV5_9GAMM|nr:MlaD family protein [Lonsdalea britannica]AXW87446.1 MCE family protein [Lonsdalea britannica]OSN06762.1 mammalian cell entry protein [Lonsdalea britannica]